MKFWQFLVPFSLYGASLLGTVNEPLRAEWFSGYRNDRIHWHLQLPGENAALTYSEINRDVQFWENGLVLKTIHRDLVFLLRGAYGAFGRGNMYQRYANLPFTSDTVNFQFNTEGWTADALGYFGYAVNLTAGRTYKTILTPLLGYSAYFQNLHRNNGQPNPLESTQAVGANSYTMSSQLPSALHLVWYGFFIGAGFLIEPGGRLIFSGGYSYHILRTRFHATVQNQVSLGTPSISDQITSFSLTVKDGGNPGQTGWAQMDCIVSQGWRAGIGGVIHYFSSRVLDAKLNNQVETLFPVSSTSSFPVDQKFKERWVSFSGWLQISREF